MAATRAQVGVFIRELTSRPGRRGPNVVALDSGAGLSNATLQQRLVPVRLFYDFLMEEGLRECNPVGRGSYTPGRRFGGGHGSRPLVPRMVKLPCRSARRGSRPGPSRAFFPAGEQLVMAATDGAGRASDGSAPGRRGRETTAARDRAGRGSAGHASSPVLPGAAAACLRASTAITSAVQAPAASAAAIPAIT
jgi:hypothetical protein